MSRRKFWSLGVSLLLMVTVLAQPALAKTSTPANQLAVAPVEIQVLDDSGAAMANADVLVYSSLSSPALPVFTAKTDGQGRLHFNYRETQSRIDSERRDIVDAVYNVTVVSADRLETAHIAFSVPYIKTGAQISADNLKRISDRSTKGVTLKGAKVADFKSTVKSQPKPADATVNSVVDPGTTAVGDCYLAYRYQKCLISSSQVQANTHVGSIHTSDDVSATFTMDATSSLAISAGYSTGGGLWSEKGEVTVTSSTSASWGQTGTCYAKCSYELMAYAAVLYQRDKYQIITSDSFGNSYTSYEWDITPIQFQGRAAAGAIGIVFNDLDGKPASEVLAQAYGYPVSVGVGTSNQMFKRISTKVSYTAAFSVGTQDDGTFSGSLTTSYENVASWTWYAVTGRHINYLLYDNWNGGTVYYSTYQ